MDTREQNIMLVALIVGALCAGTAVIAILEAFGYGIQSV